MVKKVSILLEYLLSALFGILMAISYVLFVVENNFAPAGINGIAVMIQYKFNFSIAYMSLIINIPLCIFAYFLINKQFAIKSLIFTVFYSTVFLLLQNFKILDNFKYDAQGVDTIYPVIIAGLVSGFSSSMLFKLNSSTAGTDIVAKFVSIKNRF